MVHGGVREEEGARPLTDKWKTEMSKKIIPIGYLYFSMFYTVKHRPKIVNRITKYPSTYNNVHTPVILNMDTKEDS